MTFARRGPFVCVNYHDKKPGVFFSVLMTVQSQQHIYQTADKNMQVCHR